MKSVQRIVLPLTTFLLLSACESAVTAPDAVVPVAASVVVSAGDGQTATVGTAVAIAPAVTVRDASSNPVAGVSVLFAVASGGGTVTGAAATTNASGVAILGSWTLGTTAGANSLTATVTGLPVVTATGTAVPVTSGGDSWVVSGGTAGLNMQSAWSRGTATFVGGATGVYRSDDAGATFGPANTGNDAVGPTRGFADDATYLYSSASQGVFRSSDLGATWTIKSTGITDLRTSGIVKAGTRLYVVGPSGVFRSDNQGDSWAAAGLVGVDVRSIGALGDVIVVGTNGAGIMKSVDFGATWVPSNTGLSGTRFRAVEVKGTTLFLGGENGSSAFRSTDGGSSWTQLAGGLPATSVRGFASDDQFIVAGTFGAGVFYSKDNGDTWAELNTGLTDMTIFDLVISNGFLVAATDTGGVFRIPVSSLK